MSRGYKRSLENKNLKKGQISNFLEIWEILYQNDALDVYLRMKKSQGYKWSSEVTNLDLNSNLNLFESRQTIPQNEPLVQIFRSSSFVHQEFLAPRSARGGALKKTSFLRYILSAFKKIEIRILVEIRDLRWPLVSLWLFLSTIDVKSVIIPWKFEIWPFLRFLTLSDLS